MVAADAMAGRVPSARDAGLSADAAIRRALEAELKKAPWASATLVSVFVKDCCVLLCGAIATADLRDALVAAAESVPGVRSVRHHLMAIESTPRIAFAAEGD